MIAKDGLLINDAINIFNIFVPPSWVCLLFLRYKMDLFREKLTLRAECGPFQKARTGLSEFTFSIQSLLPNDFKKVTAAPGINSSPVWFFYQWSPSADLWATIVLHDYCSNREDWKIKYLTFLIFTIEVRSEYGLVSQQCPQSSTQYTYIHTLLTWVLNTIYSSSLPGRQLQSLIQSLHDAGSLADFLSALWRPNMTTLIWPFVSLKEKMSLNNSPHIYTRTKKKEQSDLNKNSIEQGRQ